MKRLALAALMLAVMPATAQADSGSIDSISRLSGSEFLASYTVNVTEPTSSGYYGGYGYAWQVGVSESCNAYAFDGRLTWVGDLLPADFGGSQTGSDTFFANGVPFKLCLGINRASLGRRAVAERVYTETAPAPAPAPATSAPAPVTPAPAPSTTQPGPATTTASTSGDGKAAATCTYWTKQETKRERQFAATRRVYKKRRTSANRRKMTSAATKLKTAEKKALAACA